MDKNEIRLRIKEYLEAETKRCIPDTSTNLINEGYLDSFTMIKLITFIEEHFKLNVDIESTSEESFSTLDTLAEQVILWKEGMTRLPETSNS